MMAATTWPAFPPATGAGLPPQAWQAAPPVAWAPANAPAAVLPAVQPDSQRTLTDEFVRGFITSGVLAALQGQGCQPQLSRRTLRLAVQGGAALACGVAAMRALRDAQYPQALLGVAAGVAAVAAAEYLLQTPDITTDINKEAAHGQEPNQ